MLHLDETLPLLCWQWGSIVSAVIRLWAGWSGYHVLYPAGPRCSLFQKCPYQYYSPLSSLFNDYQGLIPACKATSVCSWQLTSI